MQIWTHCTNEVYIYFEGIFLWCSVLGVLLRGIFTHILDARHRTVGAAVGHILTASFVPFTSECIITYKWSVQGQHQLMQPCCRYNFNVAVNAATTGSKQSQNTDDNEWRRHWSVTKQTNYNWILPLNHDACSFVGKIWKVNSGCCVQ
jgi:hypothetical protein